ncbi:PTS system protein [Salmonella enterica subsp. enterica serovar Daytona]|uniref:PTS system protein n=1 Tax=Salmonella enterica subsp. enterica serovar Daytona TaxID=1962639 RepID=A0A447JA07_SALET|nr:PTS system protein [Salmonella enterica subsp. enterica serovar Daytona]
MDTLLFASLMGLYYWFCPFTPRYTFSAMLLQPVVIAVFVGLLLGNMQTAMIIGAGDAARLFGRDLNAGRQRAVGPGAGGLYLHSYRGEGRYGPKPGDRAGNPRLA